VVAFLDDDAFADPMWLDELSSAYGIGIGGVGGQARNGQPGEESEGADRIGRLFPDGSMTGFFAADPGETVEVDHLIGCNMSFRRTALERSGGIPVWIGGTSAFREDLFISLRVRGAGWRLLYNPRAGVRHIGAPQPRGRRFDLQYEFTAARNHVFVLVAHFGLRSPIVLRSILSLLRDRTRRFAGSGVRLFSLPASLVIGITKGLEFRASERRAKSVAPKVQVADRAETPTR
jgi:GT2 family glycosyltransferase